MDVHNLPLIDHASSRADIYTNLQGLQGIKNEANKDEAIKKVAQQFESLFVNMMMKSMRDANAVFEKGSLFNSDEAKFYRDMLDQQRSLSLSQGRGIGIAEAMYRQLSGRNAGVAQASPGTIESRPMNQSMPISTGKAHHANNRAEHSDRLEAIANGENMVERFVEHIAPMAKRAAEKLGVDHLLLVAQSALETGWGKHVIKDGNGNSSNNLFNIKGDASGASPSVRHTTLEFRDGAMKRENALFRAYSSLEDSFNDYVNFVQEGQRYQSAVANAENPEAYIKALHNAGYATDPEYSEKVLSVYEKVKAIRNDSTANSERGV